MPALWNYMILILLYINGITTVTSEEKIIMKHRKATILSFTKVIVVSTLLVREHLVSFSYLYELLISLRRAILVWVPIMTKVKLSTVQSRISVLNMYPFHNNKPLSPITHSCQ